MMINFCYLMLFMKFIISKISTIIRIYRLLLWNLFKNVLSLHVVHASADHRPLLATYVKGRKKSRINEMTGPHWHKLLKSLRIDATCFLINRKMKENFSKLNADDHSKTATLFSPWGP